MTSSRLTLLLSVALCAFSPLFFGCGGSGGGGFELNEAALDNFQAQTHPASNVAKPSGQIDVYIDVSRGIGRAIRDFSNEYREVIAATAGSKTNYFTVGSTESSVKIDQSGAERITDLNKFSDDKSILDAAIKEIVQHPDRESMFITDFIQAKEPKSSRTITQNGQTFATPIDDSFWGKPLFEQWLQSGGDLDIYCSLASGLPGYDEDKVERRNLYYLLFTPAGLAQSAEKSVIRNKLSEKGLKRFRFSARPFAIRGQYAALDRGGSHDMLSPYPVILAPQKGYEYYAFQIPEIVSIIGDENNNDKRLLKSAFLDFDAAQYPNVELGLQVYDLSATLDALQMPDAMPEAEFNVNPETGDTTWPHGKPKAPKLKINRGQPLPEVFELTFNKTSKEIGIKLHPNYPGTGSKLYQVDVVAKKAPFAPTDELKKALVWPHPKGYEIRSLFESVKLAVENQPVEKQALYTYYIQLN